MKRLFSVFLIGLFLTLLTSCATIVSKSDYPVSFTSDPSGAKVIITDLKTGKVIYEGTTPCTVTLKAKHGYFSPAKYAVTFKLPGYSPQTITLEASLDGWYLGNFIFGGLIGLLVVDPLTGAMWKLPESINVKLEKIEGISIKYGTNELKIVLYDSLPQELKAKLVKIK